MKCKRLNEVIELLQPAWQKEPDLNLLQFLQKLAKESGFDGELADLTDDILIYHLKMRDSAKDAVIPGLQKDYEEDYGISSSYVCNGNSYFRSRRGDKCNSSLQHECKDV